MSGIESIKKLTKTAKVVIINCCGSYKQELFEIIDVLKDKVPIIINYMGDLNITTASLDTNILENKIYLIPKDYSILIENKKHFAICDSITNAHIEELLESAYRVFKNKAVFINLSNTYINYKNTL